MGLKMVLPFLRPDHSFKLCLEASKNDSDDANDSPLSTKQSSESANTTFVFKGFKLFLSGFAGEERGEITRVIESNFGIIVKNVKDADFNVCPAFVDAPLECRNIKLVNDFWIEKSCDAEHLVDIAYYHRPYFIKNSKTLVGCVFAICGSYEAQEKHFLIELIRHLGGVVQDFLILKPRHRNNQKKSTHFLTANTKHTRYYKAQKNRVQIVSRSWLMKCLNAGYKVPEKDYKVNRDLLAEELNSTIVEKIDTSITTSTKSAGKFNSPIRCFLEK